MAFGLTASGTTHYIYVLISISLGWTNAGLAETEGFEPSIGLYNPITV
jgi:hypothetical protein